MSASPKSSGGSSKSAPASPFVPAAGAASRLAVRSGAAARANLLRAEESHSGEVEVGGRDVCPQSPLETELAPPTSLASVHAEAHPSPRAFTPVAFGAA